MTALEHCFLLEERSRLNFSTMLAIYKVRARVLMAMSHTAVLDVDFLYLAKDTR